MGWWIGAGNSSPPGARPGPSGKPVLPVMEVAEITGHPEMMEGRVKTLHPAVHAGLLARQGQPRRSGCLWKAQGYGPIDLVAVNLYPFKETVAKPGVTLARPSRRSTSVGPP